MKSASAGRDWWAMGNNGRLYLFVYASKILYTHMQAICKMLYIFILMKIIKPPLSIRCPQCGKIII